MGGSEKESLKGWITKRLKGGLWTEATWKHQGPPLGQENVDYPCVGIAIYLEDPIAAKAQKSCSIVLLKELTEFFSVSQSVQSLSHVQLFVTPYTAVHQASLSITNSWGLFKLVSIGSVMPSNHLILCHPLLMSSIFPSIRVFFKWVSSSHQVAKVWELQLQHQSFQWVFRVDFF